MKAPRVKGRFAPRPLDGETVWVSEDEAWVVLPRAHLERYLGRELDDGRDGALETSFGMVMGTGRERPPTLVMDVVPSAMPETSVDEASVRGETWPPLVPLPAVVEPDGEVAAAPPRVAPGWALVAAMGGLGIGSLGLAVVVAIVTLRPSPEQALEVPALVEEAPTEAMPPIQSVAPPPAATEPPAPPAWEVLIRRGEAALGTDPAVAEDDFRHAITMRPAHANARLGLGLALLAQDQVEDGVRELCAARRLDRALEGPIAEKLEPLGMACETRP